MRKAVYCLGAVMFYLVVHHKYRVLMGKLFFFFFHLGYHHIKGIKMLSMLWSKLPDGTT